MYLKILCALALLGAAPLHAQCTWEAQTPEPGPKAFRDSIANAIGEANRAAIVSAAAAAGVTRPRGLVAVSVARNGADPMVRLRDGNFPLSVLEPIGEELVARTRLLPGGATGRLTTLTRLDTLPLPRVRADGKRRECLPQLTNRAEIARELNRWPQAERGVSVNVLMLLDREGRVRHAEVVNGNSPRVNDFVVRVANRARFRPATLDGVPRDAWVSLPVNLEQRAP